MQRLGFPASLMLPGIAAYGAFALIVAAALRAAMRFARFTEHHTASFRRFLLAAFIALVARVQARMPSCNAASGAGGPRCGGDTGYTVSCLRDKPSSDLTPQ